MPAITFFALLNEGSKLDIYDQKKQITIISFPNMKEEDQQRLLSGLTLPDDVLNDILKDEHKGYDSVDTLKQAFED